MIWVRMLAYITGTVDQELLLRRNRESLAQYSLILVRVLLGSILLFQ
jgi:hypothetical protein